MIFSLSAWLAAVVRVAACTSRSKAGGLSLYPSDLLGRLQWTLEVGRWALRHRRRPVRVLCHPQLVKFKSALCHQHSFKSIIERSAFVEKQSPSERPQKHSTLVKRLRKVNNVIYINYTTLSVVQLVRAYYVQDAR